MFQGNSTFPGNCTEEKRNLIFLKILSGEYVKEIKKYFFYPVRPEPVKTVLANQIQREVICKKGYFISGKYDNLRKDIAYSGIKEAFQKLIKQILGERKEKIEKYKKRLMENLKGNGQIITDFIPEIKLITGPQPEVDIAGPLERQNRFNLVFKSFVRTFSSQSHPLVLFLDDLQWIDTASLSLIDLLLCDDFISSFFFIGAYRSDELFSGHPLIDLMDKIQKKVGNFETISLGALDVITTGKIISETLKLEPKKISSLAGIVYRKTGGNPFYIKSFLTSLYNEGKFVFKEKSGWKWDMGTNKKNGGN